MLHGFGQDHATALPDLTPAQALAIRVDGRPLSPMAMVTVDGGGTCWNAHPGDDPMAMLSEEVIPMCQRLGLGRPPQKVGVMGISMGGYGAVLLAERKPDLVSAVASISPAIWTTYAEAEASNPGAYASVEAFGANDAITRARALTGRPVRIASGLDDPFHTRGWKPWYGPYPRVRSSTSHPAATPIRSSPRKCPRRWPSSAGISTDRRPKVPQMVPSSERARNVSSSSPTRPHQISRLC